MKTINMNKETMLKTIERIERERQILLDTINNNNSQLNQMEELENDFCKSEVLHENMQDALLVIFYILKTTKITSFDSTDINELLYLIATVSYNALLNAPIDHFFEEEVLKSRVMFKDILNSEHNV